MKLLGEGAEGKKLRFGLTKMFDARKELVKMAEGRGISMEQLEEAQRQEGGIEQLVRQGKLTRTDATRARRLFGEARELGEGESVQNVTGAITRLREEEAKRKEEAKGGDKMKLMGTVRIEGGNINFTNVQGQVGAGSTPVAG